MDTCRDEFSLMSSFAQSLPELRMRNSDQLLCSLSQILSMQGRRAIFRDDMVHIRTSRYYTCAPAQSWYDTGYLSVLRG